MASNINPTNINGSYPVAGQDNDSQGFRDNFTNIRTSFQFAKEEIEALQNTTVTLTGVNNMTGGTITGAKIQNTSETVGQASDINPMKFDYQTGHYQTTTISGVAGRFEFINWPANGVAGRMRIQLNVTTAGTTVQLPGGSIHVDGADGIVGYDSSTATITFPKEGVFDFQFTSIDNGNTFVIEDLTRNRNIIETASAPVSVYGAPGDKAGMVAFKNFDNNRTDMYYCFADYKTGAPNMIWHRVTLVDTGW